MSKVVLGIDVSKKYLQIALLKDEHFYEKVVANSECGFQSLVKFIKSKTKEIPVIYLEATGSYSEAVSDFLVDAAFDVKVVNPLKIQSFSRVKLSRNKTDKADAKLIAEFGKTFPEERSYIKKTPNIKRLQALYRLYSDFIKQSAQCKNHLENANDSLVIEHWITNLDNLNEQIKTIKMQIMDIVKIEHNENYKRLLTIPGIGEITAIAILAEIGDASEFLNARQLAAYIGITPRHKESGTSVHKLSSISKIGNSILRKALYLPALVAKNSCDLFRNFSKKLIARGKKTKQIIIAVMRKLIHIIFGILKNQSDFNEILSVNHA